MFGQWFKSNYHIINTICHGRTLKICKFSLCFAYFSLTFQLEISSRYPSFHGDSATAAPFYYRILIDVYNNKYRNFAYLLENLDKCAISYEFFRGDFQNFLLTRGSAPGCPQVSSVLLYPCFMAFMPGITLIFMLKFQRLLVYQSLKFCR